jgi:hypothetical protein
MEGLSYGISTDSVNTNYPSIEMIESIVNRYDGKSVFGGIDTLCIVRYDPELSVVIYPWNGVLVTSKEAQCLPRKREKRMKAFPQEVQLEMHRLYISRIKEE